MSEYGKAGIDYEVLDESSEPGDDFLADVGRNDEVVADEIAAEMQALADANDHAANFAIFRGASEVPSLTAAINPGRCSARSVGKVISWPAALLGP